MGREEGEEEEVNRFWVTLKKIENTGN